MKIIEARYRAWTGAVMLTPYSYKERARHPDWIFLLGLPWENIYVYEGDILQWMSEDGDCWKGVIEFRECEEERTFWLVGLYITGIVDISEQLIGEDGELIEKDWDGSPKVIGNIYENPEFIEVKT